MVALFFFVFLIGAEYEPWGMDADLVRPNKKEESYIIDAGATSIIRFHQIVISPADGPRSHYYPSSSTYMLQAIRKYGFFTGFTMGSDRLLRENNEMWLYPLYKTKNGDYLKFDPVP